MQPTGADRTIDELTDDVIMLVGKVSRLRAIAEHRRERLGGAQDGPKNEYYPKGGDEGLAYMAGVRDGVSDCAAGPWCEDMSTAPLGVLLLVKTKVNGTPLLVVGHELLDHRIYDVVGEPWRWEECELASYAVVKGFAAAAWAEIMTPERAMKGDCDD